MDSAHSMVSRYGKEHGRSWLTNGGDLDPVGWALLGTSFDGLVWLKDAHK